MDWVKRHKETEAAVKASPELLSDFSSGLALVSRAAGFAPSPDRPGEWSLAYRRGDGVREVCRVILDVNTRRALVTLKGHPFPAEERFLSYFSDWEAEVSHVYKFSLAASDRAALDRAVRSAQDAVGVSPSWRVDVDTGQFRCSVTAVGTGDYGDRCLSYFFRALDAVPPEGAPE